MGKDKSAEDFISEKEYTLRMRSASTRPEDDSPGDSELDAGAEFEMGLEYVPDEKKDPDEAESEPSIKVFNGEAKNSPMISRDIEDLPNTAKVISSDQPAPWMDQNDSTSTH